MTEKVKKLVKKTGSRKKKMVVPPQPDLYIDQKESRYDGYGDALFGPQAEYTTPIKCDVTGKFPEWLEGCFIRVGPGKHKWGKSECGHWFDGDAIAHKFSIGNGKVTYQNKFLQTDYHKKNKKYNRISASGFGTWAPPDPCANIFRRIAMYFIPTIKNDNAGVNVFDIQGRTYVVSETPWMVEIDPQTLDTIKVISARAKIPCPTSTWLAHPHFDEDGTTLWFNTVHGPNSRYELVAIPPTATADALEGTKIIGDFKCGPYGGGYYHSFAVTENYVILVESPLFLRGLCALLTMNIVGSSLQDILTFKPEVGTIFRIMERKTGKEMRQLVADSLFVFHHANSYEEDGELIMDMSAYPDHSIVSQFYMKNVQNNFKEKQINFANLIRFRVPLSIVHSTDPEPYRFPLIPSEGRDHEVLAAGFEGGVTNYAMSNGKPYTYVWGSQDFIYDSRLCKVNVKTKDIIFWQPPQNIVPSFPIFMPNPGATSEDDGILLTNCTGVNGEKSFFVALDAKTMEEIGRATMPVNCVFGIHANFFQQHA